MNGDKWSVTIVKCKAERAQEFLVKIYRFIEGVEGVKDLHFLIRDSVDKDVIFSFRVLTDQESYKAIRKGITSMLRTLMPKTHFAINPESKHPFCKYVSRSAMERIANDGAEKSNMLCSLLNQLSRVVVEMAENNYYSSNERVETAHVMSWMLGLTEYGVLTTKQMEVGYYDRISDKYSAYLRSDL